MDYFHKLKSTVTGALPGNAVTREFDVVRHVASAGPGLLWKIYDGFKKSTKEEASVFVFEKKQIERYSKRDKEFIVEMLKVGVQKMTRLRHPKILSVLHPLEESRDSLAFATERVFASVANMLGYCDNMPHPPNTDITECKLYDVEIKYGLLQVTEGLTFLHNDAKIMHGNICLESIVIAKNGAWKLAGFDFSKTNSGTDLQPRYENTDWLPDYPHIAQPKLDYLAPENVSGSCSRLSDMFAYGVVMFAVFNTGRTVFESCNDLSLYKRKVQQLSSVNLGHIPQDLQQHVRMLLNPEPTIRPDADQTSKIPFFEDVGVNTLQYLDSLIQRDNLQKSQFFKGLPYIIAKLPKRVCLQRMLPCMVGEFINHSMIPFVLPSVILISEQLTGPEYCQHVLPSLVPVFRIQHPIQIILICLQNMNLFLCKTPKADIKNHILPLIYNALESDTPQIQEMCLAVVPTFADLIEYTTMKSHIFPRIKKLCLHTTMLTVRVNCLVCIGKLLEQMDRWFVLDEVLPSMAEVPSREPAVLMSILGIYQVAFTHPKLGITKDILSSKVLPFLLPLSTDSNLNLKQFNAFIGVVKEMLCRLESEHRTKLEQLNSMQQEQRTIEFGPDPNRSTQNNNLVDDGSSESMMDKFMNGFGISSLMTKSQSDQKMAPQSDVKSEMNGVSEDGPISSKNPNTTIDKAPSLSMEEKMRLAREQQSHQRLKSQQPLNPSAPAPPAAKTQTKKDLTQSLAGSDFMNTNKSVFQASSGGGRTSMGQNVMMSSGAGAGMGPPPRSSSTNSMVGVSGMNSMTSSGGMNSMTPGTMNWDASRSSSNNVNSMNNATKSGGMVGGVGTGFNSGTTVGAGAGFNNTTGHWPAAPQGQWGGAGFSTPSQQQNSQTTDLSAFDNLLPMPSNKPAPSLSQIQQPWVPMNAPIGAPTSQMNNSSQFANFGQQPKSSSNDITDIFG